MASGVGGDARAGGDARVGAQHAAPLLRGAAASRLQPRYAAVVLPVPVPRTYTYLIPAELAPRLVPGSRVVVPVRRRQVVWLVLAVDVPAPAVPARPIATAADAEPALSGELIELGRWIGSY